MSTENQAHLIGTFREEEERAAGAISPGHLIELDSNGEVVVHSTEGGFAELTFAEINVLNGETLDDDYADDELVFINVELPGNEVQAYIQAGQDVAIGDELISGGDGTLIVNGQEDSSTTVQQIIAIAREVEDLTGSGAVDTLIRVRLHTG